MKTTGSAKVIWGHFGTPPNAPAEPLRKRAPARRLGVFGLLATLIRLRHAIDKDRLSCARERLAELQPSAEAASGGLLVAVIAEMEAEVDARVGDLDAAERTLRTRVMPEYRGVSNVLSGRVNDSLRAIARARDGRTR